MQVRHHDDGLTHDIRRLIEFGDAGDNLALLATVHLQLQQLVGVWHRLGGQHQRRAQLQPGKVLNTDQGDIFRRLLRRGPGLLSALHGRGWRRCGRCVVFLVLLFDFGPAVLQSDRPVKHGLLGLVVIAVGAEIAHAFKLHAVLGLKRRQGRLDLAAGQNLQRVGIEIFHEVVAVLDVLRGFFGEEPVVEAQFGIDGVAGLDPVDRTLDLAAVDRVAALAVGIVGTMHFGDAAVGILHHLFAGDDVAPAQAHFLSGRQPEILGRGNLAEVVLINVQLATEGDFARAGRGIFGVIHGFQPFDLTGRVVTDHQLQRLQHRHVAR